jgi:hypothetical protein
MPRSPSSGNNHEESDNCHEEDEERLEGRKRRRLSLSADRCGSDYPSITEALVPLLHSLDDPT